MLVFTASIAAVPANAVASTLYVNRSSSSCSNTGPGTESQPYCTIGAAAAVAGAGQTVVVAAGTYPENVKPAKSGEPGAPVTFAAAQGANVTISGQTNGFAISSKSWITVRGFDVTGTTGVGILVSKSANITLDGNHVSYSGQPLSGKIAKGIKLDGTNSSVISDNTLDHNTDSGIYLTGGSTGNEIRGNLAFSNARGYERAAPGIDVRSSGNTIHGNVTRNNEDSGIQIYQGGNNNLIYNNVSYDNGDHGIDVLNSTGQRIVANTVYNNVTAGINVEGTSSGASIANNIAVDNGIDSPRTKGNIRVDSTSVSGTSMDYDLVHLRTDGRVLVWGSTSYSTLAEFIAATGQEHHGIEANPLWKGPSDFHLSQGSPAIDSANSGASGQPSKDIAGTARQDDSGTPNTGAGPRSYDDRGAYEFEGTSSSPPPDGPPAAALTVTPESGVAPLKVTADASGSSDNDSTPIATYRFDFGDGTVVGPQSGSSAAYTYTAAGTFTVTVTVTDTAGRFSTATDQVAVTASTQESPPSAALTVTPDSGAAVLVVTADASGSSAGSAPIATYRFDFGDGTVVGPQSGSITTHTYTAAGTFTVTVTVTDTAGLSSTATDQVTVTDLTSPTNLVGNSGFETSTTGWAANGSGITLARVAGGHSGGWSGRLSNTGATGAFCTLTDSPNWVSKTSAGTCTASLWVRADAAGAVLKLKLREYNGTTLIGSSTSQATLTTEWQQVATTYSPTAAGSSTLDFQAYIGSAPTGTCFYVDDLVETVS